MLIAMLSWWYSTGWNDLLHRLTASLRATADHFSIAQLARTLFAPFRQISAIKPDNVSIGTRVYLFFDRLVSRLIGAAVRTILILAGIIVIIFKTLIGALFMVLWPLAPLALPAGIILTVTGVII